MTLHNRQHVFIARVTTELCAIIYPLQNWKPLGKTPKVTSGRAGELQYFICSNASILISYCVYSTLYISSSVMYNSSPVASRA